ncbi:MAG: DNA transporter, partial [Desulfobacterales bacterium]|nr:DNA transporter [Desulfobacterales bacterium]
MDIPKIISPDGYINAIFDRDPSADLVNAEFLFPQVSDYITGALKEGKPWFFSGRSGNAQMGLLTDTHMPGETPAEPDVDGSRVLLKGLIRNMN